ncbi:MAG: ATP-grasp domain-containing protein [Proteobacteria bacterium]|nr:ATP-grasp domain-containing protein [Pseudomonadota bacterium]MBU1058137.1 ATP-grasp domain-containing protein [Pseudomonadota bacterium]
MFFVDRPYVSEFFKKTVRDNAIPVVGTEIAKKSGLYNGTKIMSEERAVAMAQESDTLKIYTTSENAIGWIAKHFAFSDLPAKIELFKDKLKFREMTKSIFPNFFFQGVRVEDLQNIQVDAIPIPFIIKPTVGFFSMGVYKVTSHEEWGNTVDSIMTEREQIRDLYPKEVLDTSSFIIEQCINGEEFAVDAYYNATGEAVILGIFKHTFSSDIDVSDRVYISSKEIIESNLEEFTDFVGKIGGLAGVTNFPVHIELRRENDGTLFPIEVNPVRFGGWCTTADMSFLAYGVNPYLSFYWQKKPQWAEALTGKEGKLFSLIVLDNSTGINGEQIRVFDYEKLLANFEKPLELRKIDYKKYPLFGFLFTETREDNFDELKNILDSDLSEFIAS